MSITASLYVRNIKYLEDICSLKESREFTQFGMLLLPSPSHTSIIIFGNEEINELKQKQKN